MEPKATVRWLHQIWSFYPYMEQKATHAHAYSQMVSPNMIILSIYGIKSHTHPQSVRWSKYGHFIHLWMKPPTAPETVGYGVLYRKRGSPTPACLEFFLHDNIVWTISKYTENKKTSSQDI